MRRSDGSARKAWASTLVLVLGIAIASSGCQAELRQGHFACESDGACPEGWTCHDDNRCYTRGNEPSAAQDEKEPDEEREPDPGGGGAPSQPMGGAGNLLDPSELAVCDADDSCASGYCATGIDESIETGLCSTTCDVQVDCGSFPGTACYAGECLPLCDDPKDCPGATRCHETHPALFDRDGAMGLMGLRPRVCHESTYHLNGTPTSCGAAFDTCALPYECWQALLGDTPGAGHGLCAPRCTETDDCEGAAQCMEVFDHASICVVPCTPDEGANTCPGELSCAQLGGAHFCAPPHWDAQPLPMSASMMNRGGPPPK